MPIKERTVADVLLRMPPRQQKTAFCCGMAANSRINAGSLADTISSPRSLAACTFTCLYKVPISARSSSLKIGMLMLPGIVAAAYSDGDLTSIGSRLLSF